MGKSSKPLHIQVEPSLLDSHKELFDGLDGQGFIITSSQYEADETPDIYLAPYAMRMTSDMLTQMPSALDLAIKGARTLRYGPAGTLTKSKKGVKGAQNKTTRSRKNGTLKVEVVDGAQQTLGITGTGLDAGDQTTIITVNSSRTNPETTCPTEHE